MNFSSINGVIMDMDGVLWRGDEMLPGMPQFIDFLRARGLPFALASNNSSKTPADYIAKLAGMGVSGVTEHQIVTSGDGDRRLSANDLSGGIVHSRHRR